MILVAGEALFDMMGVETPLGQAFLPVVGGSPLNVAMGVARLGRASAFLTKLSQDFFGDRLYDFMTAERIDTRWVRRAAMPATLAFVALGPDRQPVYSFYGTGAADRSMTGEDVPADLPAEVGAVHFGSIALAQEPTATTFFHLMGRLAPSRVVSLDPNIRATIIPDRTLWLERFDRMLGRADIVKASAEDVDWILGPGADPAAVARDWSRRGPALAFVTDGGSGVWAARGGEARFLPAVPVEVVDTVGAGDTFQAAILARLDERGLLGKAALRTLSDADLLDATRFAVTAAGITCSRRGADLPRRDEVLAALDASRDWSSPS